MGTAPETPAFASAGEALKMARAALSYLASIDAAQLDTEEQAECLRGLEQTDAVAMAARASVLSVFTARQGYHDDADHSARAWLVYRTGITQGAASGHTAWARRVLTHPKVVAALAAVTVSESVGRAICRWTDKLPGDRRDAAGQILLDAAVGGLGLEDLAGLFAVMYEKVRAEAGGDDGKALTDRSVRLAATIGGAGVIHGDLTPECAEAVGRVLDALSAPVGDEDDRSQEQRHHDALQEAMKRLIAAGMIPERGGQPVRVWAHISLADLLRLDGSSALQEEWTAELRTRWAAHRAAACEGVGLEGAWLDGDAAEGITCDASVTPVVTGDVNPGVLDDLVRLCVELDRHRRAVDGREGDGSPDTPGPDASSGRDTSLAWEALEQAIIGKAVDLLSGPGGLASFLRRRQLGARLGAPSLPLDIGFSQTIPAGIRHAVILRDKHCRWPGGCQQPAAACEVHHVRHKANGGHTSAKGCVLLCFFHHQVAIHRWGWTLVLNPDGTTTAWNRNKTKVLHSHGPPARAG
jgi:hypothetical protein